MAERAKWCGRLSHTQENVGSNPTSATKKRKETIMNEIYELIEQIRENDKKDDSDGSPELFSKLNFKLREIAEPVIRNGKRSRFMIEGDNFTFEDAFITENRYEEVFLQEVIEFVLEIDAYITPTDTFLAIFEHMVKNNISSYKQDW